MIFIGAHRLAYAPVPKAACSTVKHVLSRIDPKYPRKFARAGSPADFAEQKVYPTRRFRAERLEKLGPRWFRFCVIRDPLQRLLSCYLNRVLAMRDLHNSIRFKAGRVDLPQDPDPDFFFQNLAGYRKGATSIRHHSITARYFVGPDLSAYDRVYPIEKIDALFTDLGERTGSDIPRKRHNRSPERLTLDDLKPATRAALARELRREYRFMAAFYDSPFD